MPGEICGFRADRRALVQRHERVSHIGPQKSLAPIGLSRDEWKYALLVGVAGSQNPVLRKAPLGQVEFFLVHHGVAFDQHVAA